MLYTIYYYNSIIKCLLSRKGTNINWKKYILTIILNKHTRLHKTMFTIYI